MARLLVFGNEKGGCGKSTLAVHVAVGLMRLGFRVGAIDLDARQGTLSRYLKNRTDYATKTKFDLPCPDLHLMTDESVEFPQTQQGEILLKMIAEQQSHYDFLVIDTAGRDTYLGRVVHRIADTVITPINDSFIDLDLLAHIDSDGKTITGTGAYAQRMAEHRHSRETQTNEMPLDWVVVRNRLDRENGRPDIAKWLEKLAVAQNFKLGGGLSERNMYRDLFLKGLTFMDMHVISKENAQDSQINMESLQARQEIRLLLETIGLRKKAGSRTPNRQSSSLESVAPVAATAR